jgi:enoyl-CoA hydratase
VERDPIVSLETLDGGIALIELNRPEKRNAQNVQLLYRLNEAFDDACANPEVRVIIMAAAGPHFSSGHDITEPNRYETPEHCVQNWGPWEASGVEGRFAREHELYFDMCRRWRDLPKPTIAAVQGKCIGGGLMLAWVCDLIVAAEDAEFIDPVVSFGVCGVEWFAHPWELGPRKAKEFLMTAEAWSAQEAYRLGMVNRVVPAESLRAEAIELARRIASRPTLAVALVKQAVNASVDAGGQGAGMANAFALHQLAHAHNVIRFGQPLDPSGIPTAVKPRP